MPRHGRDGRNAWGAPRGAQYARARITASNDTLEVSGEATKVSRARARGETIDGRRFGDGTLASLLASWPGMSDGQRQKSLWRADALSYAPAESSRLVYSEGLEYIGRRAPTDDERAENAENAERATAVCARLAEICNFSAAETKLWAAAARLGSVSPSDLAEALGVRRQTAQYTLRNVRAKIARIPDALARASA